MAYMLGFITVTVHTANLGIPLIELMKPLYIWIGVPLAIVVYFIRKIWKLLSSRIELLKNDLGELRNRAIMDYKNENVELSELSEMLIKNFTVPLILSPFRVSILEYFLKQTKKHIGNLDLRSNSNDKVSQLRLITTKALIATSYISKAFDTILNFINYTVLIMLIPIGCYLYIFHAYPAIPQSYGGGKPVPVKLILDGTRIPSDSMELFHLFSPDLSYNIEHHHITTAEINLLYRTSDLYYIGLKNKKILSIPYESILGIVWASNNKNPISRIENDESTPQPKIFD
ncbi:MAG: hypothetical protein V3W18_12100 [candidate division Zixibacteria bacterium]